MIRQQNVKADIAAAGNDALGLDEGLSVTLCPITLYGLGGREREREVDVIVLTPGLGNVEVRGSGIQGLPWSCCWFKASLEYMKF